MTQIITGTEIAVATAQMTAMRTPWRGAAPAASADALT
jgi:hypothetical protein